LAIHYSNQHIYAQVIDDTVGRTLVAASTLDKSIEKASSNVESAQKVGKLIAERAKGSNISNVVFDRGGHLYHGKVKALADAAREGGLQF
jgi:large subunit ribosomal protein L18